VHQNMDIESSLSFCLGLEDVRHLFQAINSKSRIGYFSQNFLLLMKKKTLVTFT